MLACADVGAHCSQDNMVFSAATKSLAKLDAAVLAQHAVAILDAVTCIDEETVVVRAWGSGAGVELLLQRLPPELLAERRIDVSGRHFTRVPRQDSLSLAEMQCEIERAQETCKHTRTERYDSCTVWCVTCGKKFF